MRATATLFLALPLLLSACVLVVDSDDDGDGRFTERRREVVDASGVTIVEIDAEAGDLVIEGVRGLDVVRVEGTARASSRRVLDDVTLNASRLDGVVRIDADVPPGISGAELDLVIEVPEGVTVLLKDESGDVEISGTGSVDVQDDSGDLLVRDIDGHVVLEDDSGEIEVYSVDGDVHVRSDGSGDLFVEGVGGDVWIEEDGSGDIEVYSVDGDLIVDRDGSGRIRYDDIRGRVRLP